MHWGNISPQLQLGSLQCGGTGPMEVVQLQWPALTFPAENCPQCVWWIPQKVFVYSQNGKAHCNTQQGQLLLRMGQDSKEQGATYREPFSLFF